MDLEKVVFFYLKVMSAGESQMPCFDARLSTIAKDIELRVASSILLAEKSADNRKLSADLRAQRMSAGS